MNFRKLFNYYIAPLVGIAGAFFGDYPDDAINDSDSNMVIGVCIGGDGIVAVSVAEQIDDGSIRIIRSIETEFDFERISKNGFHDFIEKTTGIDEGVVFVSNNSGIPDGLLSEPARFSEKSSASCWQMVFIKLGMKPFMGDHRKRFFNVKSMLASIVITSLKAGKIINDAGFDFSSFEMNEKSHSFDESCRFKISQGWLDKKDVSIILLFSGNIINEL